MAARHEKTRIEILAPAGKTATGDSRVDESVLCLARLIGRQIAREQFKRQKAKPLRRAKPELGKRPA